MPVAPRAAWTYPQPSPGFEAIAGHVAVYARARWTGASSTASVVRAQEGGFYGGWITSRVVGPFKGGPGSRGW